MHRCKAKAPICTYQGTLLLIQSMNEGHLQLQSFHERLPPSQFRVTIIVLIQQISAFFIFDIFKVIFFNCLLDLGTKFLCFFLSFCLSLVNEVLLAFFFQMGTLHNVDLKVLDTCGFYLFRYMFFKNIIKVIVKSHSVLVVNIEL